ncbi:MAG: Txe/YoeB family addiction module toxin [Bacteroidales bacterium]|jgi:toxin YoeB|nr:Txe/YoeB family addiction module toxin [Bacteroidales bacterium]
MKYRLEFWKEAKEVILRHQKSGDKQILKKIYVLFEDLKNHPETGTGKPERLKHEQGNKWSRRITDKHRLIYEIFEHFVTVEIIQTYGHYNDK